MDGPFSRSCLRSIEICWEHHAAETTKYTHSLLLGILGHTIERAAKVEKW